MGCWGPGLYQDDKAKDLKNTIGLLSGLPVVGDRILEILLSERTGSVELTADGGPTFWLVAADQFERRGIACEQVFRRAIEAIDSGADLEDQRAREMGPSEIKRRAKVLEELRVRLLSPRAAKARPTNKKPPAAVVEAGQVYSFPTTKGEPMNPWSPRGRAVTAGTCLRWEPDGYGAMLILGTGRAYDWFQWCAYSGLSVPPINEPTLDDVLASHLLTPGRARLGVPRRQHLARMEASLVGSLQLDPGRVAQRVAFADGKRGPEYAVFAGWSLYPTDCSASGENRVAVAELLPPGAHPHSQASIRRPNPALQPTPPSRRG